MQFSSARPTLARRTRPILLNATASTLKAAATPGLNKRIYIGGNCYFPEVKSRIPFIGPPSRKENLAKRNPLAFRYYDAQRVVEGKTMEEHFRFGMAFWHTMKGRGTDIFGGPAWDRAWDAGKSPMANARRTMDAAFEFMTKMGMPYWCFHDRDIAPMGDSIAVTNQNLKRMVAQAKRLQQLTGVRLLWGTANLFSEDIYAAGAFTNPDPRIFARAGSQVRRAIDATAELGGRGYTFWGGREGYSTLFNTDMAQELDQLARALHMCVDYKKRAGFKGTFFIEPKPKEPTKHQYDSDVAACLNFLRWSNLLDEFKINFETNHGTLAGHSAEHELLTASIAGRLGSIDANYGDELLGWDTDQFLTNVASAAVMMAIVLSQNGIEGGFNHDAKLRRDSFDSVDLFHAHIGSMDTFARGLLIAAKMRKDGVFTDFRRERYAGYRSGIGQRIMRSGVTLEQLEPYAMEAKPGKRSGRQEFLENRLWDYVNSPHIH